MLHGADQQLFMDPVQWALGGDPNSVELRQSRHPLAPERQQGLAGDRSPGSVTEPQG